MIAGGATLATLAVVAVVWGGTLIWGLMPHDGISWQGHLFGALGGVIAARVLAPKPAEKRPEQIFTF